MKKLYERLEEFEKLTSREMVFLGEMPRKEYENRFGKVEEKVSISYFTQPEVLRISKIEEK